jgi:hypothetical protein
MIKVNCKIPKEMNCIHCCLVKQHSLRSILERKEKANQFLYTFNRKKRFFLPSFVNFDDDYKEKHVRERRRKGLALYEEYCESTDRLPRACLPIDRCKCGVCKK